FRVQAGDSQGNWNEIATSLAVTVNRQFWQTWWFACSFAAFLGVAIFSALKRRLTLLERRRAEQESVTRQIILSQENERKRVAGELHDGLSQNLALLSIEMEMLNQDLPTAAGELTNRLQALSAQTKGLSAEVHRISHGLHPAKLTQLGLAVALRGFCREVAAAHKITVHFADSSIPRVLPEDVALCLYRVAQEAVQNVVKHSGAKSAKVELTMDGNAIELNITDDGKGFELNANRANDSLGLVSMEERVRLVHGQFSVESKPAAGTHVRVRVPLPTEGPK
ncbi:MAG TPA: sensor histidine kinase, partial [Verrucomicrobiae bacterium]